MSKRFLPVNKKDMDERGWKELDVIIVTGDAYADHPSYGAAVIGRVLENAGFRVGLIPQPDCQRLEDFRRLGRPKLFFGVTAGNLDSMVANYTANKNHRRNDDYSAGGKPNLRPDRASIVYTNRIKEAFPDIPVVLGGVEAGLRRLAHYDYWSDKVRRSILLDAKADILVYGMGEKQVLEIAERLKRGHDIRTLDNIRGTVVVRNKIDALEDYIEIPPFEEVADNKDKFNEAFRILYSEFDPLRGKAIVQKHRDRFAVQFPPALPLTTEEMDGVYLLNYARAWHPAYDKDGGVPGFETVRFSIIAHRGCPGECSFCSLYMHQGRIIQSRSRESILKEAKSLAERDDFRGTITDIGGPTANMYKAECKFWKAKGACVDKKCLIPAKCKELKLGDDETLKVWKAVTQVPKVKHLFIESGVRYDLLVENQSEEYLKELCANHISGQLKVAPEHSEEPVLKLMNKPSFEIYEKFIRKFNDINKRLNKKQYLVNYFISAHPGADLDSALNLSMELMRKRIYPEQIQDFLPLPMTISGCMYYTKKDPFTGKDIYVATALRERKIQRALIQYKQQKNKRYIIEALRRLDKMNLISRFTRIKLNNRQTK
ncbi:MAG: YgiQ family radical SAM protein [Candidatus Omnitrophota bacterium]|nr:YgiQ family radical SAM protein [Candidatus Omnitrophota bacterium]